MRILTLSTTFAPTRGGVQTVVEILSGALLELGQSVSVVTTQADQDHRPFPFNVLRRPSAKKLLQMYQVSDAVLLHGPSLRLGWPLFLTATPAWIVHHIAPPKNEGLLARLARRLLEARCKTLAVSHALAEILKVKAVVVPNPYDATVFKGPATTRREEDIIFVGRLIWEKGCDLLLDGLKIMASHGVRPKLTVVGSGPEERNLREQVTRDALGSQVSFVGEKNPTEIAAMLQQHKIIAVPSRCEEAFGIVALEGIAMGCTVVGFESGGLPDAVGPCGMLVPKEDVDSLADALQRVLKSPDLRQSYQLGAPKHLAKHHPTQVAKTYLDLMLPRLAQ